MREVPGSIPGVSSRTTFSTSFLHFFSPTKQSAVIWNHHEGRRANTTGGLRWQHNPAAAAPSEAAPTQRHTSACIQVISRKPLRTDPHRGVTVAHRFVSERAIDPSPHGQVLSSLVLPGGRSVLVFAFCNRL
ncbi:hypothetical protein M758_5G116600 [Ceratodon purpureus]|nr:hypothetical protein M758_5G116600 [Ceratodon purpureus]